MKIVIDQDNLSRALNPNDAAHIGLVLESLNKKRLTICYGGTRFKEALGEDNPKYLRMIEEHHKANKWMVLKVSDSLVDRDEANISRIVTGPPYCCNDTHVVAILRISRSHLLCSDDKALKKCLSNKALFPPSKIPKPGLICSKTRAQALKRMLPRA